MKSKNRICIRSLIITVAILSLFTGCKKNDDIAPILFNPSLTYGNLTDQDGNNYKTVTIGTQVWMAENLRTIKYRNGDPIPNMTDYNQWFSLTKGACCIYDQDVNIAKVYGYLYNWYAVSDSRYLAPMGWHIPTEAEWEILVTYLGGDHEANIKLREAGTTHWVSPNPNTAAANISGFTGLPAGSRQYFDISFFGINYYTHWWSSDTDEDDENYARVRGLSYWFQPEPSWNFVENRTIQKTYGLSVRCIKDQ